MVRFITRYFIGFEVIVNGIVFWISFSVDSWLAYRKATDFFRLILYATTLLNLSALIVFWLSFLGLLNTVSCHLKIILILLFLFEFL